jgi:hypothetical protein
VLGQELGETRGLDAFDPRRDVPCCR